MQFEDWTKKQIAENKEISPKAVWDYWKSRVVTIPYSETYNTSAESLSYNPTQMKQLVDDRTYRAESDLLESLRKHIKLICFNNPYTHTETYTAELSILTKDQ